MTRLNHLLCLSRRSSPLAAALFLVGAAGDWQSVAAQTASAQSATASIILPDVGDPPGYSAPFSVKKGLTFEYRTAHNPTSDVTTLNEIRLASDATLVVVASTTPAGSYEALLVSVEFTFANASKVYVIQDPIKLNKGQYEVPAASLNDLLGRLKDELNAALPPGFDPSKPLPLSTPVKVNITPVARINVDPTDPKKVTYQTATPLDITFDLALTRKLGKDEERKP